MSKIVRTNERCYICDFGRAVTVDSKGIYHEGDIFPSCYQDSLTSGPDKSISNTTKWYHRYQNSSGRFVFIDNKTGQPICSYCYAEAMDALEEMRAKDRDYQAEPWGHDDLTKIWDNILDTECLKEDSQDLMDSGTRVDIDDPRATPMWNVDWDNLNHNDNDAVTFPLKLKDTPKPLGWAWHTRAQRHPLTDEHREQIERLRQEGKVKHGKHTPRGSQTGTVDDHWQPLPDKPGLPPTSNWPVMEDKDG